MLVICNKYTCSPLASMGYAERMIKGTDQKKLPHKEEQSLASRQ
jgi:hypothetical protein